MGVFAREGNRNDGTFKLCVILEMEMGGGVASLDSVPLGRLSGRVSAALYCSHISVVGDVMAESMSVLRDFLGAVSRAVMTGPTLAVRRARQGRFSVVGKTALGEDFLHCMSAKAGAGGKGGAERAIPIADPMLHCSTVLLAISGCRVSKLNSNPLGREGWRNRG